MSRIWVHSGVFIFPSKMQISVGPFWVMPAQMRTFGGCLGLEGGNRKWLVSKGWSVQLICKHILPCIHVHVRKMLAINTTATHSVYLGLFLLVVPAFYSRIVGVIQAESYTSVHTTSLNAKSVRLSAQSSRFCLLAW